MTRSYIPSKALLFPTSLSMVSACLSILSLHTVLFFFSNRGGATRLLVSLSSVSEPDSCVVRKGNKADITSLMAK